MESSIDKLKNAEPVGNVDFRLYLSGFEEIIRRLELLEQVVAKMVVDNAIKEKNDSD